MGCGSAKDANANIPVRSNATATNITSAKTTPNNSTGIDVIFVLGGPGSGKGI